MLPSAFVYGWFVCGLMMMLPGGTLDMLVTAHMTVWPFDSGDARS